MYIPETDLAKSWVCFVLLVSPPHRMSEVVGSRHWLSCIITRCNNTVTLCSNKKVMIIVGISDKISGPEGHVEGTCPFSRSS